MKKFIGILLLSGYFGFSQPFKVENDILKGSVKSLELFVLRDLPKNDEKLLEHKTFDEKGRTLISKTFDDYSDRIRSNERNQYSDNQIITEICDCKDLNKAFANFSDKGNQKFPYKGYGTNSPNRTFKHNKITDKNGNIISAKIYNSEGYLTWVTKSTYDEKSNLLLEESFDNEGKKTGNYKKYTYNEKGLITEKIESNNFTENKRIFKYDDLGRIISEKYSDNSEFVYEYITVQDTIKVVTFYIDPEQNKQLSIIEKSFKKGKNKITEKQFFYKGTLSNSKIFEYDKNKKLISIKLYNVSGYRQVTEFVYDKKANWVELNFSKLVNTSYKGSTTKSEWKIEKYIRKIQYY